MLKKLFEKAKNTNTRNKLILSIVTLISSILGGISIAIFLKNIISFFILLSVALNLEFLFEKYNNYKKDYCYELADKYFKKYKNNIDANKAKIALKKKVEQNKFWNSLFIGSVPLSFLLAMILFCCNISLLSALTYAGITYFSSIIIIAPCMGYSSFGIDVLCEVIEKIENSKVSTELAKIEPKKTIFSEEIAKLTYNHGISLYRYKYVPEAIRIDYTEKNIYDINKKELKNKR